MAKPKLLVQRGSELTPADLIGQAEAQEICGISRQAIHHYMRRKRNPFPQPVARSKRILLWDRRDVLTWAEAHFRRREDRKAARGVREQRKSLSGEAGLLEILECPDYRTEADDGSDRGWEHHAYRVALRRGDVSIEVPWRQGLGITDDPTAAVVLEALLSDASGVENARGDFEEWAGEYGYDTDSRKAEAIFRAVTEQTEKLKTLLGDDFDSAVFPETEDAEETARQLAEVSE